MAGLMKLGMSGNMLTFYDSSSSGGNIVTDIIGMDASACNSTILSYQWVSKQI